MQRRTWNARARGWASAHSTDRPIVLGATALAAAALAMIVPATVGAQTVQDEGTAFGWGQNGAGQLGEGSIIDQNLPSKIRIPDGMRLTSLAAATNHSLGITTKGTFLGWGGNAYAKLGDDSAGAHNTPSYAGAVPVMPLGELFTAVAPGLDHSIALTSMGRVFAWGYGGHGELGDRIPFHDRVQPQPVVFPPGTFITAISSGAYHNLALSRDGFVYSWGYNGHGELGLGNTQSTSAAQVVGPSLEPLTNVEAISAGDYHSLALKAGKVLAWGYDGFGQLGDGSPATDSTIPVVVELPPETSVASIAAGFYHSLAVTTTGSGLAWGFGDNGNLGTGTPASAPKPQKIDLPPSVRLSAVSGGHYHSMGLTTDGRVLTWGHGGQGQLGISKDTPAADIARPVIANLGDTRVRSIDAGDRYSLALVGSPSEISGHDRLAAGPAAVLVKCSGTDAVLTDVYRSGAKVRVVGVTDPRRAGQSVFIRRADLESPGAVKADIGTDGGFAALVDAPSDDTEDAASYTADLGGTSKKSSPAKLTRRLNLESLKASDDNRIAVKGRMSGAPLSEIGNVYVKSTDENCKQTSITPQMAKAGSDLSSRIGSPANADAMIYRLYAKVTSAKTGNQFETFSLYRGIPLYQEQSAPARARSRARAKARARARASNRSRTRAAANKRR